MLAVEREGAGWDHVAWRVETADGPWIVRAANAGDARAALAAEARREVAVMQLVRRRLGGWAADAVVLDADLGCIAHRRVPGVPLQDLLAAGTVEPHVVAAIAGRLGALVREIGGSTRPRPAGSSSVDDDGLDVWLAEAPAFVGGDRRPADAGPPGGGRGAAGRARCRAAGGRDELVLVHNDLGAEHVLVDPADGLDHGHHRLVGHRRRRPRRRGRTAAAGPRPGPPAGGPRRARRRRCRARGADDPGVVVRPPARPRGPGLRRRAPPRPRGVRARQPGPALLVASLARRLAHSAVSGCGWRPGLRPNAST